MKTVNTKKGTALPLMQLKGKDYLQVAHRIQWFTEEEQRYTVNSNFLVLSDEQTVAQVTVTTFNEQGQIVRQAMGTKRETKKDFPDHTEKAETGALGRALIELGYGTQFALADLEEGTRLVDSPVVDVKSALKAEATTPMAATTTPPVAATTVATEIKKSSFRKTKSPQAAAASNTAAPATSDEWS